MKREHAKGCWFIGIGNWKSYRKCTFKWSEIASRETAVTDVMLR